MLILYMLFSLSDHQFIKCLHTTEIIRGIPRCVSKVKSLHYSNEIKNVHISLVTDKKCTCFCFGCKIDAREKKGTDFIIHCAPSFVRTQPLKCSQ